MSGPGEVGTILGCAGGICLMSPAIRPVRGPTSSQIDDSSPRGEASKSLQRRHMFLSVNPLQNPRGTGAPNEGGNTPYILLGILTLSLAANIYTVYRVRLPSFSNVLKTRSDTTVSGLRVQDLNGRTSTLNLAGHGDTLLYVFSPHCMWCARNHENLRALASSIKQKYRLVGLSLQNQDLVTFLARHPMPCEVLVLANPGDAKALNLGGTPEMLLVAPSGKVVHRWLGAWTGPSAESVDAFFGLKALPGLTTAVLDPLRFPIALRVADSGGQVHLFSQIIRRWPAVVYFASTHCHGCDSNLRGVRTLYQKWGHMYTFVGLAPTSDAPEHLPFPVFTVSDPPTALVPFFEQLPETLVVVPGGAIVSHWSGEYNGETRTSIAGFFGGLNPFGVPIEACGGGGKCLGLQSERGEGDEPF